MGRISSALLWMPGILFLLEEVDAELGSRSRKRVSEEDGYGSGQGVFVQEWDSQTPTAKGLAIDAVPLNGLSLART